MAYSHRCCREKPATFSHCAMALGRGEDIYREIVVRGILKFSDLAPKETSFAWNHRQHTWIRGFSHPLTMVTVSRRIFVVPAAAFAFWASIYSLKTGA